MKRMGERDGDSLPWLLTLLLSCAGCLLLGYWLGFQAGLDNWKGYLFHPHPSGGFTIQAKP